EEFRRILKPDGWLALSIHHPMADTIRLDPARYLDTELVEDYWKWVGTVCYYRRPLSAVFNALTAAGLAVERVVEPLPTDDFRRRKPESYEQLLKRLPSSRDVVAADGSDVRILLALAGGSMAHFQLAPGRTSKAVRHRTVDEIWFVLSGRGEMWRAQPGQADAIVALQAGVCLTIPLGTRFQFRSTGSEPLAAVGITMPPWPGDDEAVVVDGAW